jgi:transcriptional regulator with XRE-family HTH domain
MRDLELGRLVRALRHRRGWRQEDCARRAGVHRSTWSNLERGRLEVMALATVRECLAVLEVRLELLPRWRGSQLDRILDERHARLQAPWKLRLERWGWITRAEASFNRYGDRGRIDLLAWHPSSAMLLVIEIKTEVVDIQEVLGGLDVKRRVASHLVAQATGRESLKAVPMLLVADTSTNRDRIRRFGGFDLRGRQAVSWLRHPNGLARGLLVFSDLRDANGGRAKSVGSHRVRVRPAP